MNVLFDIVHPAQVHFFKNCIRLLIRRGDKVLITAREKDVTFALLRALGLKFIPISRKRGAGLFSMAGELLIRDRRLYDLARAFKPDVMVARVGISISTIGQILRVPSVVYDDMETAWLQGMVGLLPATYICTGLGYYKNWGRRQVRFRGAPVLAYLSPAYFTPDRAPLIAAGLDPEKPCIFIRRVSWAANHDLGRTGVSDAQLHDIIRTLSPRARVVISSEAPLPAALKPYENPVPVGHIHDLLAFACLCMVEGGTMAAEAAVLGTPAVCLNTYDFGYLRELEHRYRLIFRPGSVDSALNIAQNLLDDPGAPERFAQRRCEMLAESDDVTRFQLDIIDHAARHGTKTVPFGPRSALHTSAVEPGR